MHGDPRYAQPAHHAPTLAASPSNRPPSAIARSSCSSDRVFAKEKVALCGVNLERHLDPEKRVAAERFHRAFDIRPDSRCFTFRQTGKFECGPGERIGPVAGTIVDATIISAPSSTKNADKQRDPEMHQTKKGSQLYFGMKAHIGVDSRTRTIHTVAATAANVHDSKVLGQLLHGRERRVYGDSAYRGQRGAARSCEARARDFTNRRAYRNTPLSDADRKANRRKSAVRSYVEHAFGIIKGRFGFQKVRYRGITKNPNRLNVLAALANIVICKKRLLRLAAA